MSNDNAIAPAFPIASVANANGEMQWGSDGLTKREYFAAMAMQGMLASETEASNYGHVSLLAEQAVKRADALLAELAK